MIPYFYWKNAHITFTNIHKTNKIFTNTSKHIYIFTNICDIQTINKANKYNIQ